MSLLDFRSEQTLAGLCNLIIYSHTPQKPSYLHELTKRVLEQYPCRIINIQHKSDATQALLNVSPTKAVITQGETSIVCDQINIDASGEAMQRVPFIILPLLIPDLPINLIWEKNPADDKKLLPFLQQYADRLIFDSADTTDLIDGIHSINKLTESLIPQPRDLQWVASAGWREAISQIFDSAKKLREFRKCNRLEIVYNNLNLSYSSRTEMQALYLQSWIAAILGWTFLSSSIHDQEIELNYHNGSHEVTVVLLPLEKADIPPGSIIEMQLLSSKGYSFIIQRKENQAKVVVHITTPEQCEMPFMHNLTEINSISTLLTEFFYRKSSSHYRQMLQMLAKISLPELPHHE